MTAASNKALVVRVPSGGQSPTLSKEDIPLPKPAENQVLIKLSHVAQNPTDVQSFDSNTFGDGAVLGCDFVGEVIELGSNVTRLSKGDVIAGLVWGGEVKGVGAYSHYCLADERISYKLPGGVSRAEASTIPLAAATAWLALFSKNCLGLERSQASSSSVLIWGGSTSVGLYGIQLASLCGFDVVSACSPKHFDMVKSYGAKHVFDYKDGQVAEKIKQVVPNLMHVFDTANTENVAKGTQVTDVLVWTSFLKDHSFGDFKWPASKHDHELSAELFERLPQWLQQGSLKPNNPKVYHGLDAVRNGFQEYRDGKISAYKIVYVL
ncbi:putative zinc-binding dehydrogenase family oxidoreductase [Aspergillus filifer]